MPAESAEQGNWREYDAQDVDWEYSSRDETLQPIRCQHGADKDFVDEWLGVPVSDADIHHLAGAPPGARVSVAGKPGHLTVSSIGQTRIINRDGQEVVACYKTLVSVPLSARSGGKDPQVVKFDYCTSEPGRTGFGTDMVVRMVSICERLGYEHIKGLLVGDGHDETENATGYYVWVSQGFDAPLAAWRDLPDRPVPDHFRMPSGEPVITLQDLFRVPGGPEWWWTHGSTIEGVFQVQEGSPGRLRLAIASSKLARDRRKQ